MPNQTSWEASIGRTYKTRGGERVRITDVLEDGIACVLVNHPDVAAADDWELDGNHINDPKLDLIEMDRSTNQDGIK